MLYAMHTDTECAVTHPCVPDEVGTRRAGPHVNEAPGRAATETGVGEPQAVCRARAAFGGVSDDCRVVVARSLPNEIVAHRRLAAIRKLEFVARVAVFVATRGVRDARAKRPTLKQLSAKFARKKA